MLSTAIRWCVWVTFAGGQCCVGFVVAQPLSDRGHAEVPKEPVEPTNTHVDFAHAQASEHVHALADWIVQSGDHQGMPFVLVDKIQASVFVFDKRGVLMGQAPVLVGLALGDEGVNGIGDRPLSQILPDERITPAGRFLAYLERNSSDQEILWVDYEQSISLHAVRSTNPKERRLQRLATATAQDNRISYGCINVPTAFWREVIWPAFADTVGVVYVLPETRAWRAFFGPQLD